MSTNTNVQLIPGDLVLSGDIKTDEVTPTFSVDRQNSRVGIGIDASSISNPYTMYVAGEMYATRLHGDGSQLTGLTNSAWDIAGGDISYADGDVSIGIADANGKRLRVHESGNDVLVADGANLRVGVATGTPQANLHVEGNVYVSSNLEVSNVNFTGNLYQNGSLSAALQVVPTSALASNLSSITSQWGSLLETQWFDNFYFSTVSSNQVEDITVDSNGNVYVTGSYRSTSTWNVGNSVTFPAQGGSSKQSFTIKYNSTGTPQWGKTIGGNLGEGRSIVTDSSGNVYVTGSFNSTGTVDLGNSVTLPNLGTITTFTYIVKYNTGGTAQWANAIPATDLSDGYGIALDSNGNVYVTGRYRQSSGTTSLGNGISLPTTAGNSNDPFIVKYNSSGVAQWGIGIGCDGGTNAEANSGLGIATDSNGDVYVTGNYYHAAINPALSLGNGVTLPANAGDGDAFIVKYNTSGTPQWARVIDAYIATGYDIATDSSGNIYVTGTYEQGISSLSIGNSVTLPGGSSSYNNIFTVKYDTNGTPQWANALETSSSGGENYGYGIATDSNGNVYITGNYNLNNSQDLGNNITLPTTTTGDGYVIIYDTDGTAQGVRVINVTAPPSLRGIATGSNDTIFIGGNIPTLNSSVAIDDTVTLQRTTTYQSSPEDNIGLIIKYSTQENVTVTALTAASMLKVTDNTPATTTTTGALTVAGGVGVGGAIHVGGNLDVSNVNFTGNLYQNGTLFKSSPLTTTGNDIYYTTGNVGVGTTNPGANLHVEGNAYVSSNLEVGTANLFVDTTNSRIGIGVVSPDKRLHVYTGAGEGNTQLHLQSADRYSTIQMLDDTGAILFGNDQGAMRFITGYDTSLSGGSEAMRILGDGNVGIGETPSDQKLQVNGGLMIRRSGTQSTSRNMDTNKWITLERSGNKVDGEGPGISFQGSYHQTADYNNYMAMIKARGFSDNDSRSRLEFLVNDGTSSSLSATGDVAGYFDYDSNGGQVNFTGQHRTFIKDFPFSQAWDLEGLIVSSDQNKYVKMEGGIEAGSNAITINEALPVVSLSTTANDKKCFGVISNAEDPENREDRYGRLCVRFKKEEGDTRFYINSVGEGGIWVIDVNGTLESGDYITTSNLVGYGQKQDDDFLHNYTVAKITMDCDFNPVTQSVQIIKRRLTDINYWIKTEYENISEDEYLYITEILASNLSNEKIRTITETKYTNKDTDITLEEYNTLEPGVKLEYKEETRVIYQRVIEEKFKTEKEGYEFEVRRELVNVLDEHGQIQWEDDPSGATEKAYKIRYLDADGNITDEANAVHKAAFVGCTYHCG